MYTDVTTLAEAKNTLRIDDTLTEDDAKITSCINAAWQFIEKWTNILVYARDKDYLIVDECIRVYDYPINSVVTPAEADMTITRKTGYTIYEYTSTETADLTLNVGYTLPDDVPDDLKQVADEIIDLLYYEHETGKSINKDLSSLAITILNQNKRFII